MTTFVVSNGTVPEMVARLPKRQPTQMYITLPAPNEKIFQSACSPLEKNLWKKIQKSLSLLHKFDRSTLRLTAVKGINMLAPEEYAALIDAAKPDFVEVKAYMFIGHSRKRLKQENMPLHGEISAFARKIAQHSGYTIKDFSKPSRVVLLAKDSKKPTKISFK